MSGHNFGEIPRFIEELAYLRGLNVRNNNSVYNLLVKKKKNIKIIGNLF